MAHTTLLTNNFKTNSVMQTFYAPNSLVSGSNITEMYCFLSRVGAWDNDLAPPNPTQDLKSLRQVADNTFVAKRISVNDISPVIKRVDWKSGVVYNQYQDNVDLTQTDSNGNLLFKYYVKNSYDQIFKCLSNNAINSMASINEPVFEPGSYNTNKIYTGINDNYKWKYLYTISTDAKLKFMDSDWIPVLITNTANLAFSSAGLGNVDVVNITNSGSGYTTPVTLQIIGANTTTATGSVQITNGQITDVIITNSGSNYSSASINLISTNPTSNASFSVPISPVGGHGTNPLYELGCSHVMITSTFTGPETNDAGIVMIPTDIDYHQLGLVINPSAHSTAPNLANGAIYKTTTDLIVSGGQGLYAQDETVYQGSSIANATFTATVLSFDSASNVLKVMNTSGNQQLNDSIRTLPNGSGTTRTLLNYSLPDLVIKSGYIVYIENRSAIQRSYDGIEQFKIVLGY